MNRDRLVTALWQEGDTLTGKQVYLLLDGARHPDIAQMVRFGKLEWECLFGEPLSPRLRAAAPYLVHLAPGSPQTCELLDRSSGDHWGILLTVPPSVSTRQLRLHFKKLLWVHDERGRKLYFRFYDPRVLCAYLSTCTQDERDIVFGPVGYLHCISDGSLVSFPKRAGARQAH